MSKIDATDNSVFSSDNQQSEKSTVARGMVLMIAAMLILPIMDGIAKILSTHYDVTAGQITFGRFLVQACILGPIIVIVWGKVALWPKRIGVNLFRGAIMGTAVLLFFTTLRYMPIADAIAVFFIEPFILTILSMVFLREYVGWRRGVAIVVGFVGAMFIIQPSYEVFGAVSLLPIGTAFLFAIYLLLTRMKSEGENPMAMQFVAGIGGVFALAGIVMLANVLGIKDFGSAGIPEFGIRWALIFAIGLLAAGGHLVIVHAFKLASASVLAPFQYLEIVTATMLGYWLFNDFPDGWKWFGIFLIIGSGIYIFTREARLSRVNKRD